MRNLGRSALALVVGLVAAAAVILALQWVGHQIWALPEGVDPADPDAMAEAVRSLPVGAFLSVLVAWGAGTFAGAWVAARVAGRAPLAHALAMGVLLLALGVSNLLTIPHPAWMWVGALVVFLGPAYLVGRRLDAGAETAAA